jgi:hypothetical protein
VAKLSSMLLKLKFGIWGQQLWLFANGRWSEPLLLTVKDRTTISSSTTLPYDEPDYEAALTFTLSETIRLVGQLRREQLRPANSRSPSASMTSPNSAAATASGIRSSATPSSTASSRTYSAT